MVSRPYLDKWCASYIRMCRKYTYRLFHDRHTSSLFYLTHKFVVLFFNCFSVHNFNNLLFIQSMYFSTNGMVFPHTSQLTGWTIKIIGAVAISNNTPASRSKNPFIVLFILSVQNHIPTRRGCSPMFLCRFLLLCPRTYLRSLPYLE